MQTHIHTLTHSHCLSERDAIFYSSHLNLIFSVYLVTSVLRCASLSVCLFGLLSCMSNVLCLHVCQSVCLPFLYALGFFVAAPGARTRADLPQILIPKLDISIKVIESQRVDCYLCSIALGMDIMALAQDTRVARHS